MLDDVSGTFIDGEQIQSIITVEGEDITQSITIVSSEEEYNAAHHYENADSEIVDIDPYTGPGAQLTEITNYDRYYNENEELKTIKIIKPNLIEVISKSMKRGLKETWYVWLFKHNRWFRIN